MLSLNHEGCHNFYFEIWEEEKFSLDMAGFIELTGCSEATMVTVTKAGGLYHKHILLFSSTSDYFHSPLNHFQVDTTYI
jgi:hypothetical protein